MQVELLIIDPQWDFCHPDGWLFVPGADADMSRVASMVLRLKDKLDDIHVTLDSHHYVDIAHPIFWANSQGKHPDPFTIISADDVDNGVWRAFKPPMQKRASEYVHQLAANGRYPLCIWPPHCLIGSQGAIIMPDLFDAFLEWEKTFAQIHTVTKGSNFWTEHYSAVQADVPDPEDPSTHLDLSEDGLIHMLTQADIIALCGEARSHCLANTFRDIANNFGEENIKKCYLLEDATSDVVGFEQMGEDFVTEMKGRGMNVTTTVDFLK